MPLSYTLITSEKPRRLTKRISLHGTDLQTETGGQMIRGTYIVKRAESLDDFATVLSGLRQDEALTYGIPKGAPAGVILTREAFEALPKDDRAGHVARIKEHFHWPEGPGIFMLDIDPPKDGPAIGKGEAISLLRATAPELRDVPMLWYPSSSSYIHTDMCSDLHS